MQLRVAAVFAKLLGNVCFVEMIIHAYAHIHKYLRQDNECQKYGEQFFQSRGKCKRVFRFTN